MAFKPHYGTCSCGCGKTGLVCVSAGYIQQCNERIKKAKKEGGARIKPIVPVVDYAEKIRIAQTLKGLPTVTTGDKVQDRMPGRKKTGEGELFDHIWATREHKCEVCDQKIVRKKQNWVRMFSHVLSKGSTPELRLDEENVLLMGDGMFGNCDHHPRWEARTDEMRNDPMWRAIFLLAEALKKKASGMRKNKPIYTDKQE